MAIALVDCCEPIFQVVCRLRRAVYNKVAIEYATFRKEIAQAFAAAGRRSAEADLNTAFEQMRPMLCVFVDECVRESQWNHVDEWRADPLSRKTDAGSQEALLVDFADKLIRSPAAQSEDVLEVLQMMISLSIPLTPLTRARLWREISQRLASSERDRVKASLGNSLFPQAYAYTDRRDFSTPAGPKVGAWVGFAVLAVGLLLASDLFYYYHTSGTLRGILDEISRRSMAR